MRPIATRPAHRLTTLAIFALALLCLPNFAAAAEHRIGLGANYWKTIDDLEDEGIENVDEIDDSGVSEILSYQYFPKGILGFELTVEHFPDGFGGATDDAYSPQIYVVVGRGFYGAVGIGATNSSDFDGDWSDPFYAAKAGFNLGLLPNVSLDLYGNYRFDAWSELEDADTDTIFLGAQLRISF